MWDNTQIEELCKSELIAISREVTNSANLFTNYEYVRNHFCNDLYQNIAKVEPDLTDHGENHIKNVLINAYELFQGQNKFYQPLELYVMCMAILIHDIGNLNGRAGHEKTLTKFFNPTSFPQIERSDMKIIIDIAKAHGGGGDTISKLQMTHLLGKPINSQCIAALVRFADELAEGPQRTSRIIIENGLISEGSLPYHQYADCLIQPSILNNAIKLEYHIIIDKYTLEELHALLNITFHRIDKLNHERIYCGHYSEVIQKIKKVIVKIDCFENKDSFDVIEIDSSLVELELSNLNCKKSDSSKISEHIENIMSIISPFCKETDSE